MKILHVNSYDFGGAAKACIRLHEGLLEQGISSQLLLKQKTQNIRASVTCPSPPKPQQSWQERLSAKLRRIGAEFWLVPPPINESPEEIRQAAFLAQRPSGLETCSFPNSSTDICRAPDYLAADVVHLHWVARFVDWSSFFPQNRKPIVWTLHDQNPFLGIEHYAERFLGIDENGKPIPRKYTPQEIAEEKKMISFKKKILEKVDNLTIVAPSKWLMEESHKSEVLGKYPHYHIPYGFPTEIFKPYNKNFCREILGIPQGKKVVLFVADSIDNHRKGFIFFKKALEKIDNKEVVLCAVGSKANVENKEDLIELGRIHDERMMAMAYSAADVFVIPSLEDNLPNTMIESLLCGTPVIGFLTGGIRETIQNGINGYLCNEISVAALAHALEKFINDIAIFDRKAIANDAKAKYSLEVQAKAYIALYNRILNE